VAEIGQELAQREYDRNGVYPARWVLLNLLNTDPRLSDKGHDLLSTFVHRLPTAKDVLDRIAADTKQNPTEIRGPLRSRDLVAARHLAINIIRRLTKRSLPCIAKFMGGRDHTTALYSCSKIDTRRQEDPGFHAEVLRTEFEIDKAAWVRGRPVIRIHTSEEIQAKSAPGPVSKFAKNEDEDGADLIKRMLDARRQPLQLFLFEDDYDDEDPDELRHG
jgi:ATPase involved in DNA replication initiation